MTRSPKPRPEPPAPPGPPSAAQALCLRCGLCCNGVLFADVELGRGDDPRRLRQLGFSVESKGRRTGCLSQPCSALEGTACRHYERRPRHCRDFECGLLQRVVRGDLTPGAALRTIRTTQRRVEELHALLRAAGNRDESAPLSRRCAETLGGAIDLSRDDDAGARGRLLVAAARLNERLRRWFLTPP